VHNKSWYQLNSIAYREIDLRVFMFSVDLSVWWLWVAHFTVQFLSLLKSSHRRLNLNIIFSTGHSDNNLLSPVGFPLSKMVQIGSQQPDNSNHKFMLSNSESVVHWGLFISLCLSMLNNSWSFSFWKTPTTANRKAASWYSHCGIERYMLCWSVVGEFYLWSSNLSYHHIFSAPPEPFEDMILPG